MNSKQLQYAVALSKIRSFSQVSQLMNISQPALSKQIQTLEKSLGVRLFDRNSSPVTLTPAGECFIREAEALLRRETKLLETMEQFASGARGRLTIGVSPFRNLYMMPPVIRKLKQAYPGIQVILRETNSDQLRKEAAEGEYDLAIVTLPVDESELEIIPLEPEVLALAVPRDMADGIPYTMVDGHPAVNFADCAHLPFITVATGQEMRRYFDNLCARADLVPEIALEVAGGVTTAWSMAYAGIGATLLPLRFVKEQPFDERLCLYTIKGTNFNRQPVIAIKRGRELSAFARYAIELITDTAG